jgi:methyl-accepting chemotaxis protein-like sensor
MSRRGGKVEGEIARFASEVAIRIDSIVQKLNVLAVDASSSGSEYDYFVDVTRQMLVDGGSGDVLAGAGYALSHGNFRRPPAMVWWVHRGDSVVERTHSVDPDSESFYDYASLRWFRTAASSGLPTLSGPFIDAWGSNDYTVTVSVPVSGSAGLQGVVAADVDVRRFVESLTADLRRMPVPLALVNESDRVVVSTVPALSTGLPIRPRSVRGTAESPVLQRFPVSDYGWSVVTLSG